MKKRKEVEERKGRKKQLARQQTTNHLHEEWFVGVCLALPRSGAAWRPTPLTNHSPLHSNSRIKILFIWIAAQGMALFVSFIMNCFDWLNSGLFFLSSFSLSRGALRLQPPLTHSKERKTRTALHPSILLLSLHSQINSIFSFICSFRSFSSQPSIKIKDF